MELIIPYLDDQARIKSWPAKNAKKRAILIYLSTKFELSETYTEAQVNAIITRWHTFEDLFVLRRGMIETGCMARKNDGSQYWRVEITQE